MHDIRQTENYARYMRLQGWTVETIEDVNYFLKKFPLVGHILKIQRPQKINFQVIDNLCRKYRVFQIILEPNVSTSDIHKSIINHGFKLTKQTYLPSKTLQIDLTQTKEKILSHFKKDARYAIRKAIVLNERNESKEGRGFTIHEYSSPSDIKKFREVWKKSVNFQRFVPGKTQLINLRKSFPHNKSLFLASHNISGSIIGGLIFTSSSHGRSNYITYYWSAFTSKLGRASLSQYSLLYYGILWAKKQGYKVFDFEGIYDPRFPNHSWLGFTHFKKSFGGYEVEYPGCYIKWRLP